MRPNSSCAPTAVVPARLSTNHGKVYICISVFVSVFSFFHTQLFFFSFVRIVSMQDEKHMKTIQAAAFVLDLIFYIPFLILADMIWSREQQLKRYHDSFDQQPTKRQDVPPSTSRPESASLVQPVPWSVPVDTPIGSSMTQ